MNEIPRIAVKVTNPFVTPRTSTPKETVEAPMKRPILHNLATAARRRIDDVMPLPTFEGIKNKQI